VINETIHSNIPEGVKIEIQLVLVDNSWGSSAIAFVDETTGQIYGSMGLIIIAHKVDNQWLIAYPTDNAFITWLPDVPSSLIDDDSKTLLYDLYGPPSGEPTVTAQSSNWKLPWPAGRSRCISGYGYNQGTHTGTDYYSLDFGLNYEDVVAIEAGTVTEIATGQINTYPNGALSYGNYVLIDHGGILSLYAHLESVNVSVNQAVSQGYVIGKSGNTGYSSGPHLHFRLRDSNRNPIIPEPMSGYTGFVGFSCSSQIYYTSDNGGGSGGGSCPAPNLNSPSEGYVSNSQAITFSWSALSGCTFSGYTIHIKDTSNMDSGGSTIRDSGVGGTSWTETIGTEWNNKDLYWGVRAANAPNGASWSVRRFRIEPGGGCNPGADQIALYVDANYSGTCVVKGIGNYPDPGSMGIANDAVSSVKIGSNVKLTLYVDSNYGGTPETFTGDDSNLSDNTIGNDRASSAKVESRSNPLPSDYGFCAEEGQTCAFSGTAQIYYGANNQFVGPVTKTDGVACNNDVFGDPISGTHKQCFIKGGQPQGSTFCANEGSTCSFGSANVATVYFGANGKYNTITGVVSSIACNTGTFGDPFSGIGKACYYIITGTNISTPSNPNPADNTTFPRTNNTVLSWNTNGTSCTIHIWGGSIDISPTNNCSSLTLGNQRGGAYNWQVTASNGSGSATGPIWHFNIKPYAPTNLSMSSSSATEVTLNWTLSSDESADIDEYDIYQNDQYIGYVTQGISNYTVSGLTCDGSYSFYVKSKRQGVLSDASNTVSRGSVGCVPAMPGNLTVSNATLHSLTLSWQDNSNNESGFKIYRWGYDGAQWTFIYLDSVAANATSYTQNSLVCGNDFNYYEVSAYNTNGESQHAGWVQGTTSPCPDLVPFPRDGREDPIIISSAAGTTTNDTLYAGQIIFIDWGFKNLGNADVNSNYYIDLFIDDQRFIHYPYSSLGAGALGGFDDWGETWNTSGWHTVKLVVDPDNTVDESNEDNNVWTKDFYWEPTLLNLTVTKTGTGSGTVTSSPAGINCGSTCSYAFAYNTQVTLTASPTSPSTFGGWGGACSGTGTCTVTMEAAKSVTATFNAPGNQTLTVSKSGTGSGTVTSSPSGINCGSTCSYTFAYNTQVTLTASPTSPSTFGGWSGACSGTGTCTVTMDAAKSVTANFNAPGNQTLTVSKSGTGSGTVTSSPAGINCGSTCSYAFAYNTQVTLMASPTSPSTFGGWGGACSGTGTCAVTMDAAKSVTATFNAPGNQTLTVTKTGTGSGTVTSSPSGINCGSTCSYAFVYNTQVTLTASPTSPSTFGGWGGTCSGTGTCTVTMDAAKSVTANFTIPSGPGTFDDSSASWVYTGTWVAYSGAGPYSNTMHYTNSVGAGATFVFNGIQFILTYTGYSNRGSFEVWVDGALVTTVNAYSASLTWQRTYTSPVFTLGVHRVEIKNTNTPAGSYTDIDAIQIIVPVDAGIYDDTHTAWTYSGAWTAYSGAGPYSNTMRYTNSVGAAATIVFNGSQFVLTYTGYTNRGSFEVWVDGAKVTTVNAYNASLTWQKKYVSQIYAVGIHTVVIKNTNTPAGSYIDVDAIQILRRMLLVH
jgi:hypothetical protein